MMMTQKTDSNSSNSSGQLLRDIEEISKALYLHKAPARALLPPYDSRSKSAEKTRFSGSNPAFLREDLLHKDKKSSSSIWNWKKPLKALSHFGNRKFSCCFYLHVHSLEGLPVSFNHLSVCVHWKRKDAVLQTSASRVEEGVAEFDETLMHRCTVYGSRNGANHSVKYEEKLCLVYISVSGAPGLDIGKHWVDLTRLLPLTFEELEGEKSSGKWSTSFNLSGKAKGAKLNVSLGFLVTQDKVANLSGNPNVPQVMDTVPKRASSLDTGARILQRVGSVPSNVNRRSGFSSQTIDMKVSQEVMLTGGLELSKSINFFCQRLDEGKLCRVKESDSEDVVPLEPQPDLEGSSAKGVEEDEDDDIEFTIIEVGTEIPEKEKLNSDRVSGDVNDESAFENIYVDGVIKDNDMDLDEKTMIVSEDVCGNYVDDFLVNDTKHEDSMCIEGSNMKEVEFASHMVSESDNLFALEECLKESSHRELKSSYMASKTGRKSLSLDDATESVSNEFLNMLGMDGCSSSNGDPESPRELLLREFEKEAMTSGDLFFNDDWNEEQSEFESFHSPVSYYEDYFENSDLSMIIQAAEEESKRESDLLKRRKANILEGLETEALMQEWGLNEKDFQNSPRILSGGFGSPIDLPVEEPLLPSLEVGFGPYVRLRGGGFLRSMNPTLFRNAKNSGTLVIQVSNPVVIPAKMGYDVVEILQHLALVGIDKLEMQVSKLMPMENITGKTIPQVALEAVPTTVVSERFEQILSGESKDEGFPSSWDINELRSELAGGEMGTDYVSLECLVPLAISKIEALSLEGLRIQSHMSDSEAPSSIYPASSGRIICPHANSGDIFRSGALQMSDFRDLDDNTLELLDLSLSLEEWLKVDATISGDEDQSREQFLKILAAHDAKCTDLVGESLTEDRSCRDLSGRNCGILGNNLTIALMVQLRDPFRNYEPVGVPMLALVQVERGTTHSLPKIPSTVLYDSNEKEHGGTILEEIDGKEAERNEGVVEGNPQFKIIDVHLAGVDTESDNEQLWGTTTQLQSGSRWLLAAGLGKTIGFPVSNSKAMVRLSPQVSAKMQHRDSFWSISSSSHVQDMRAAREDLIAPHIRNPNVIFSNETIKAALNM